MYGRNELIARYIKLKTGKSRTRKQVSSHIQVLGRRKLREIQAKVRMAGASTMTMIAINENKDKMVLPAASIGVVPPSHGFPPAVQKKVLPPPSLNPISAPSSAVPPPFGATPTAGRNSFPPPADQEDVKPFASGGPPSFLLKTELELNNAWEGRSIATPKLSLVEFSAFMEFARPEAESYARQHLFVHIGEEAGSADSQIEAVDVKQIWDKFPEKKGLRDLFERGPQNAFFLVKFWADLNYNIEEEASAFYGVTSRYESCERMEITCSTKLCSFGKQVVEKVETEYARFENGRFVYNIHRSPMCEYMINFIHKLKHLPAKYNKNSVLENFTILQVITNRKTDETLLCNAYVFEVSTSEYGAQHHIYRLVKD
ncbi:Transcriptional enhancer factor [Nesidiocoris tenuis]|uniref:Transcriptional enhancer factor n=1 Tax=Nesidiocoris tenuis TaxID=355587 RepID=A0ABN7ALT5_9HEMI|nr:Transcriptional enhancer factor [Nesidiocoris tenuis]